LYLDFGLVFTVALPMPKLLRRLRWRAVQRLFGWDHRFFVSDLISVVFGPFWLMLPGLGPNR